MEEVRKGAYKDRSGRRTPGEHLKLEGAVSGKAFCQSHSPGESFWETAGGTPGCIYPQGHCHNFGFHSESDGKTLEA